MSQPFVEQQRRHWDSVAAGWAQWLEWTERNFAPVTEWLARNTGWTSGVRVLDTACGAGYPALAAATRIAPDGDVTAIDLSPEMVAVASQGAVARGASHVSFRQMDTEHLDFDDSSFDVVTNVYGLMFSPDPVRAIEEARRVLKPGGHLGVVVWDEYEKSPFFHVITDVARRMLALSKPAADAPGPFRFATPRVLEQVIHRAGFSRCRVENVEMTIECASTEEYIRVFRDVAWKGRIAALGADAFADFARDVASAARPYECDGVLRLAARSWCAVADA